MLFKEKFLTQIKAKKIETAFRKWTRPTVKEGGTLLSPVGVLRINSIKKISYADISDKEILEAGYDNRQELDGEFRFKSSGDLYQIKFKLEGEDPRISLRKMDTLSVDELDVLQKKLEALQVRSKIKEWPMRILEVINKYPGKPAIRLANSLGYEKQWFKLHVRKLKTLGLTISLEVGYELSSRGKAFLKAIGK